MLRLDNVWTERERGRCGGEERGTRGAMARGEDSERGGERIVGEEG